MRGMLLRALGVLLVSAALAAVRADDSTCAALSLAGDNAYWDEVERCGPCVAAGCVYVPLCSTYRCRVCACYIQHLRQWF